MIFYFSGTGNSEWVAKLIASEFNDKIVNIAKATINNEFNYTINNDEKVGFIFPVYSWAPPQIVLDFIKKMNLNGSFYTYFICTCGDDTGLTPNIISSALNKRGIKCNAGFSITMPNTYVALPGFKIDDDIVEKNKVGSARERIKYIIEELKNDVNMSKYQCHIGSVPFIKSRIIWPLFNKNLSAKQFYAFDKCISCKKCEESCPVNNIKIVDGKPQWGDDCTQCFACFHSCPVNVIQYGKFTLNKKQYKGRYLK